MIKSMTGYGKSLCQINDKKITVEIRSVNGKQSDCKIKSPQMYNEKEMEIRAMVTQKLVRGTIDVFINTENVGDMAACQVNTALVKQYVQLFKQVAQEAGIEHGDFISTAMRMPEVTKVERPQLGEEEWEVLRKALEETLNLHDNFRCEEGKRLENDFVKRINLIEDYLKQIENFESNRIQNIRDRIKKDLATFIDKGTVDESRFEQELVYYIEKLDITEEKTRLRSHCHYFIETMQNEEAQGRKLGFIGQEMGREINTIGSKANDLNIQKLVVLMKDELEKIKEQVLNVL